jgi:uncharacterized membrane protein
MDKRTFLRNLREELKRKKIKDIETVIYYYDELIENEEDFINKLGDPSQIVQQFKSDEKFIDRIKEVNLNSIRGLVGTSVQIISSIIHIFIIFVISVTGGSIVVAGGGIIIQSLAYLITESRSIPEILAITGVLMVGSGLVLLGINMVKVVIDLSNNLKLKIIRKTKDYLKKKEGYENE